MVPTDPIGAYTAERAAALSGVPFSTVNYWAREDILVPTFVDEKPRLWSFTDLLSLRVIYWLRRLKTMESGAIIPATSMPAVRCALARLKEMDLSLISEHRRPNIRIDGGGRIYLLTAAGLETTAGQLGHEVLVDPLAPFETHERTRGPDLHTPRPHLRIVPGKLAGSPHVARTRLETVAVAALARRGYAIEEIAAMYPFASRASLAEAIDLEEQLGQNVPRLHAA